jgi:hypothetical protein
MSAQKASIEKGKYDFVAVSGNHLAVLKAVRCHTDCSWVLL